MIDYKVVDLSEGETEDRKGGAINMTAVEALDRIPEVDSGPRGLHSIICLADPTVVLQKESETSDLPLSGLPIVVKDNIDTVDLGCTAGSVLLEDVPVKGDAPVVTALEQAGAVLIGKSNLSEWANFRSRRSVSGWSSVGGQTVNPVSPGRTPCGSSSGSAAAVAAGLVPAAIGTETDGSIICPAATMGLVGFKPTVGRVPTKGIVPISARQDTAGPIATTVSDVRRLQRAMEGKDPGDTFEPASLKGAGIGVYPMEGTRGSVVPQPGTRRLFDGVLESLRSTGAVLVDLPPLLSMQSIEEAEWTILKWEFFTGIERYLKDRRPAAPFRNLAQLAVANRERSETTMPYFGQDIWDAILVEVDSGRLSEESYTDACDVIDREAKRDGMDRWFTNEGLDVVIAPANGPAWMIDTVNGDRNTGTAKPPGAAAGYPVLTVPMGRIEGLPIGLGFFGPAESDERLLAFGSAWERLRNSES